MLKKIIVCLSFYLKYWLKVRVTLKIRLTPLFTTIKGYTLMKMLWSHKSTLWHFFRLDPYRWIFTLTNHFICSRDLLSAKLKWSSQGINLHSNPAEPTAISGQRELFQLEPSGHRRSSDHASGQEEIRTENQLQRNKLLIVSKSW
jgi:hypothetical protein